MIGIKHVGGPNAVSLPQQRENVVALQHRATIVRGRRVAKRLTLAASGENELRRLLVRYMRTGWRML